MIHPVRLATGWLSLVAAAAWAGPPEISYVHPGTGVYRWKPDGQQREALNVINTGQTENGFFVVQVTGDRIRLGYRSKMNVKVIREPGRAERREWDGTWGWRFLHSRKLEK